MIEVLSQELSPDSNEYWRALEDLLHDGGSGNGNYDDGDNGGDGGGDDELPEKPEEENISASGIIAGVSLGAAVGVGAYRLERPLTKSHQITFQPSNAKVTEAGLLKPESFLGVDACAGIAIAALTAVITSKLKERRSRREG